MRTRLWLQQNWGLVRRERAEHYLRVTLVSFAASVSITRLFLTMSGYPQVGGGEIHIAHVLWGGLILFVAALLPLVLSNRRVYGFSAALAGLGVGLFIDEVGKFITARNDYFYPAAASVIYICFVVTVWIFYQVRRTPIFNIQSELNHALEDIQEMLQHPLQQAERDLLEVRLRFVANDPQGGLHSALGVLLLDFIHSDGVISAEVHLTRFQRRLREAGEAATRLLSSRFLRIMLVIGLIGLGLLALKNPASSFLTNRNPDSPAVQVLNYHFGRQVQAAVSPRMYQMRVQLEIAVSLMLLVAGGRLIFGRQRSGIALGYLGLLLAITAVDPLLFYFEQFSTINLTIVQFVILLLLLYYRSRYVKNLSLTPPVMEEISKKIGMTSIGEEPGSLLNREE